MAPRTVSGEVQQVPKEISEGLSRSDRAFLKAYAAGGTLAQIGHRWAAARGRAVANDDSASSLAFRKLGTVRRKIASLGDPEILWDLLGLSIPQIARVLSEGMEATKVIPLVIRVETIETVTNDQGLSYDEVVHEDRVVEAGPYSDHRARIKAAFTAAKLRGDIR